jgi:ParB family chromosome partitioning protein
LNSSGNFVPGGYVLRNGDVIDGIMMEDKKEVDKVILTGAELGKYFGKETTPREMKNQKAIR